MGRLSQSTKAAASKQQRTSLLANPRLAAALGTSSKTRSPASRLSLGLLGVSKASKQSPKGKRFSLGGPLHPSQQHQAKARGRKSDPFPRPAANVLKLSPQRKGRKKSMPALGGGGRTSTLFGGGAKGFNFDSGASSDEEGSDDDLTGSGSSGGSEGGSEGDGEGGMTDDDEQGPREAGESFGDPEVFVPDPALEKQMARAVNRGPLVQAPALELASIEQILSQSNEMAETLFVDELGQGMSHELLQTIDAMEQRVRIGVNTVRQGKEKVIKEFDANFEQQRTLIARLIALQDRLLTSRKTLSTELGTLRDETSTRLETLQHHYYDTCVALKRQVQHGAKKSGGGAGGKKR